MTRIGSGPRNDVLVVPNRREGPHSLLRRLTRFTRRYSESPPDSRKFAWKEWKSELDRRKGIEKGILLGKTEMIREMLRWGDTDEKILACARITPEELAALKEQFRREAN